MKKNATTKEHEKEVRRGERIPLKPFAGDSRHKAAFRAEHLFLKG